MTQPSSIPVRKNKGNNLTQPDFPNQTPQDQTGEAFPPLQQQITDLTALIHQLIQTHHHNGNTAQVIELNTDLHGLFEVVSAVPTGVPQKAYDQIKIYTNSTTYRLYWYDQVNHAWRYATGT